MLQTLLNRIDFGMTLPDAIAASRASNTNSASTIAEPAFISQSGDELQTRFGQQLTSSATTTSPEIGAATGIEFLPGGKLEAAAEPTRRGGGDAEVVHPGG